MLRNIGYEILIASPPSYESLVAEIYLNGKFVALISQENGDGVFDIEFPGADLQPSELVRKVDWAGFHNAVERACQALLAKP